MTLYGGMVSAGVVVMRGSGVQDDSALREHILQIDAQLTQTNEAIAMLRARSGSLVRSLRIERALSDRPDYSALLAAMGGLVGEGIMFERIVIEPTGAEPDAPAGLALTGLASDQKGVSQFVLALERTGLFERVELRSTNRHDLASVVAVRFDIRCVMNGGGP